MATDYRNTSLWKTAFSDAGLTEAQRAARAELSVALDGLETHVSELLKKIPDSCKELTVHDIRHVHQLWDVASTICGPPYPINPLEGFVLGAAFLIHDSGLTAAAYPGGVEGLKGSPLYRDGLAIELKRDNPDATITEETMLGARRDQKEVVLFRLLRQMHADRALSLLDESYVHPLLQQSWTLIPVNLLFYVGEIIGEIASSHNWDAARLTRDFGDPLSPPAAYSGWTVDAFKLACILRCADACAIDERRAPLMAFVLENPFGVSRDHWKFQSFLNPAHLPQGQDALVFRSKRRMKRENMDAWWLAYEAIKIADRELRDCDRLLKSRAGQGDHGDEIPFAAKRVEGAGDAARLAELVTVEGWVPVDTAARISDPAALIELLGGSQLYGNDHTAPIRELIQNAADAIRARRESGGYGPSAGAFPGRIEISIQQSGTEDWTLTVSDDGIGMPSEVLTGALLDFGRSLWRSQSLAQLYPGLASNSNFRPTGRFGIRFFASFIIGKNVKVLSRPYNRGDEHRKTLHFKNGLRGHAEFREYNESLDGPWPYGKSTIVRTVVKNDNWLSEFAGLSAFRYQGKPLYPSDPEFWEFFAKTVEKLTFCLDVRIRVTASSIIKDVNRPDIFEVSKELFASEFNRVFADDDLHKIPPVLVQLIESVDNGVKSQTRGTITIDNFISGIYHVGGLTVFSADGQGIIGTRYVTGVHQAIPVTVARQSPKRSAPQENFRRWAEDQFLKVLDVGLPPQQLADALMCVHAIGVDLGEKYFLFDSRGNLEYFSEMILDNNDSIFVSCMRDPFSNIIEISNYQGLLMLQPPEWISKSDKFRYILQFHSQIHNRNYNFVEALGRKFDSESSTAIGQLFAEIRRRGFDPTRSDLGKQIIGTYTGPNGGTPHFYNPNIEHGMEIEAMGIVITIDQTTR